jgi:hypothetical protein
MFGITLKKYKMGRQTTKGSFDLTKRVDGIMCLLIKLPERIKAFFWHPAIPGQFLSC